MITSLIPCSLAISRKTYLTDFIISTRIEQSGFSNTQESAVFSYEATADALAILHHYDIFEEPGLFGSSTINVNISLFQDSLKNKIQPLIYSSGAIIYDLYHLYTALDLIDYSLTSAQISTTKTYLDSTNQTSGGFAPTNTSTSASLISTYYVINLYSMIGKLDQINKNLHKEWIINCSNSDGGFGGNTTLPSTLLNTYLGVLSLNALNSLNELPNPSKTIEYLNSFYISEQSDLNNFGGYAPDNYTSISLLSSTYYCTKGLSLLDSNQLNDESTKSWVLSRQNFEDGGFTENSEASSQKSSSVLSSYFAFETLKLFNADLDMLNENIWMVEFSWVILIILLSVIGIAAILIITVWRKRRI